MPEKQEKEDAASRLKKLIGLSKVKKLIENLKLNIEFGDNVPPGYYVFAGNPGTGKTTVVRLLGDILREGGILKKGHIVEVTRQDLVAEYVGQTAVKTTKKLEEAIDGIFFIDEAYSLASGGDDNFGVEAIETIFAFMVNNREQLCVVFAGYTEEMKKFVQLIPWLKPRISATVIFDDYTADEMTEILQTFAEDFALTPGYIQKSKQIFDHWIAHKDRNFGNARDVRNYFQECKDTLYKRLFTEYGSAANVPEVAKKTLTGQDVPPRYSSIAGGSGNG